MDFLKGRRIRILHNRVCIQYEISLLRVDVDGVFYAADAGHELIGKRFVGFLEVPLSPKHVLRPPDLVENLRVVVGPCADNRKRKEKNNANRGPRAGESQARIPQALAPLALLPTRPEENGHDVQQAAEEEPVNRKPAPGNPERRVTVEVRINNPGTIRKLRQVAGNVEGIPGKEIDEQENDVKEIPDVLIRRQHMNKKRKDRQHEEQREVTDQQLFDIEAQLETMESIGGLHDNAAGKHKKLNQKNNSYQRGQPWSV